MCVICGRTSHKGCVKQLKSVQIVNDKEIKCCEGIQDNDASFSSAYDSSEDTKSMEIGYLKLIIEQKDTTIKDLREFISTLNRQIDLLNRLVDNHRETSMDKKVQETVINTPASSTGQKPKLQSTTQTATRSASSNPNAAIKNKTNDAAITAQTKKVKNTKKYT
ncbi:unnamed protein product [Brassicogethes aeneus]|uniref:Phorbol-ester/DAG-type domain-containing protein n=1 Tax=Brassicogethes aeneus TaxID=1431903 RepID=A0A9P0FNR6_BRAAE|nr:unnamed protein product [Brassicogethes aeneus]